MMRDPAQSTFAFVMYPEATPIVEASRAIAELESLGIPLGLVVANMVLPDEACRTPYARARWQMQQALPRRHRGALRGPGPRGPAPRRRGRRPRPARRAARPDPRSHRRSSPDWRPDHDALSSRPRTRPISRPRCAPPRRRRSRRPGRSGPRSAASPEFTAPPRGRRGAVGGRRGQRGHRGVRDAARPSSGRRSMMGVLDDAQRAELERLQAAMLAVPSVATYVAATAAFQARLPRDGGRRQRPDRDRLRRQLPLRRLLRLKGDDDAQHRAPRGGRRVRPGAPPGAGRRRPIAPPPRPSTPIPSPRG